MKKIYAALTAMLMCLLALPLTASAADDASSTYAIKDAGRGFFVGGSANKGTLTPRTWRNTANVVITLNGATTDRQQQFAIGDGNTFLANGAFTLAAPKNVTISQVEFTVSSPRNRDIALNLPADAEARTISSATPVTVTHTFDAPVETFDFAISGKESLVISGIKLTHSGDIRRDGGGSITTTPSAMAASPAPANGWFAPDTKWFAMTIHADGYVISDNGAGDRITLGNKEKEVKDANLWCFVGDDQSGYTIYNRATGLDKVLAAPKEMKGATGAESYPILLEPGDDEYCYLWKFYSSTAIDGKTGYYIGEADNVAAKMNKRGNNLAFWDGGADMGSTFLLYPALGIPTDDTPAYPATEIPAEEDPVEETYTVGDPVSIDKIILTEVNGSFPANAFWFIITNNKDVTDGDKMYPLYNTDGTMKLEQDLASLPAVSDKYIWCVAQSPDGGYMFYNREAGPGSALAAATPADDNTSVAVQALGKSGYSYNWDFYQSDYLSGLPGYFLGQHGQDANKMNRNGVSKELKFWTGGADAGSTFLFHPVTITGGSTGTKAIAITPADGEWISASNSSVNYARGWHSNSNPQVTIMCSADENNIDKREAGFFLCHKPSAYTFSLPEGEKLLGIEFDYKNHSAGNNVTIDLDGTAYNGSDDMQHVRYTGGTSNSITITFGDSGNNGIELHNVKILVPAPSKPSTPGSATTLNLVRTDGEEVNANNDWAAGWRSNTEPQVSIMVDGGNRNIGRGKDYFDLRGGQGGNCNYTISVPEEWVITAISFDYKNNQAGHATSINLDGIDYTGTDEYQTIEVSDLETSSLRLTVTDGNNGAALNNIRISVKPEGAEDPAGDGVLVIENPDHGSFSGGHDNAGTTARDWTATISGVQVKKSLTGGSETDKLRFAKAPEGGFLILGNFSLSLPEGVKITKVSTVTRRYEGGTPTLYFEEANDNKTHITHEDDADHTTEYLLPTPASSLKLTTGGSKKLIHLKKLTIEYVDEAGVTGIDEVTIAPATEAQGPEVFYDIYGRRATELVPGRLYISNHGRKLIVR